MSNLLFQFTLTIYSFRSQKLIDEWDFLLKKYVKMIGVHGLQNICSESNFTSLLISALGKKISLH